MDTSGNTDNSIEILNILKERFSDYTLEIGRGDRLLVNGKIIKGILLYNRMRMLSVNDEVKFITELINHDIK